MENTELIALLKTFKPRELKKLDEFLNSPYFNRLKKVSGLYAILKEYYSLFDISKEDVFARLFPGEKFDDLRLRVLFTRLLALTQRFLAYESYSGDEYRMRMDTGRELLARKRAGLFKKNMVYAGALLEKLNPKDEIYYHMLYEHKLLEGKLSEGFSSKGKDYSAEGETLLVYSTASLLKMYTTAMNSGTVLDMDINTARVEKVLALAEEFKENPLVKIYYSLYLLLKYPDEEKHFTECLNNFNTSENISENISNEEKFELYTILLNYCVLKVMSGRKEYMKHKFNIYETILNKGYFTVESGFPYPFFNNIVNSAIEVTKYAWAESFIESNKHLLPAQMKDNIVYLCMAKLHYAKREYEKALESLARVGNTDDPFYKIALRDLQVRILFDMGHYENIFPVIDSYQHFLTNNRQLNKKAKDNYRLYLKCLKKLVRVKTGSSKVTCQELVRQFKSLPNFVHKEWLSAKIL
jgi:hypothetical protein